MNQLNLYNPWLLFSVPSVAKQYDVLGLGYTSDFQIKFQQYDNYLWDPDGREWDDIRITKILQ